MNSFVKKKASFFIAVILSIGHSIVGQKIVNGDLEGNTTLNSNGFNLIPDHWNFIPFDDSVCEATDPAFATPDLVSINGPSVSLGLFGYPYSGNSFVRGAYLVDNFGDTAQEGIMQEVSGFEVGCKYYLSLAQCFLNHMGQKDLSGSWKIYVDDRLISTTSPSFSNLEYDDPNLNWELRSTSFIASNETHFLKFLPVDDDSVLNMSEGVHMGIDNITIEKRQIIKSFDFISDTTCHGKKYTITTPFPNLSHKWQDGSNDKVFYPQQPGKFWVNIEKGCVLYTDSIEVDSILKCQCEIFIPLAFTPNDDQVNDIFQVVPNCIYKDFELSIFNRWGDIIFKSHDPENGWTGIHSNIMLPQGIYVYSLIMDGETYSGTLTLLK